MYPYPEYENKLYIKQSNTYCWLSKFIDEDFSKLKNSQILRAEITNVIQNISKSLYKSSLFYAVFKLVFILGLLYFMIIGLLNTIYGDQFEGIFDFGLSFVLILCIRGAGFAYL